jgi:hypothetical protein
MCDGNRKKETKVQSLMKGGKKSVKKRERKEMKCFHGIYCCQFHQAAFQRFFLRVTACLGVFAELNVSSEKGCQSV